MLLKKYQNGDQFKKLELPNSKAIPSETTNKAATAPKQAVQAKREVNYRNSPEYKAKLEAQRLAKIQAWKDKLQAEKEAKKAQVAFEKERWDKYNESSFLDKAADRTKAALSEPLLMTTNLLMGKQAYIPGMSDGLDPESPNYNKYLKATSQPEGGIATNNVFKMFNPGAWGLHSGNEVSNGNYASGYGEFLTNAAGLAIGGPMINTQSGAKIAKIINNSPRLQAMGTMSQAKNLKEVMGTFNRIPTPNSLPRMSEAQLKDFRKVQEISRMGALEKSLADRYKYGIDQNLSDEHFEKIFGMPKSEAIKHVDYQAQITGKPSSLQIDEINDASARRNSIMERARAIQHRESIRDLGNSILDARGLSSVRRDNTIRHLLEDVNDYDTHGGVEFLVTPDKSERTKNTAKTLISNMFSNYPTYSGTVEQTVPYLGLTNSSKAKVLERVAEAKKSKQIIPGTVFTGSLNTSHSSYLPQLKDVFKYTNGEPYFLGYKPMNSLGFLNEQNYSRGEIAKYLNTEIDEQIKRGIIPKNIQRPFILKDNTVMLPHYGIKQFKNGGVLYGKR